MRLTCIDVEGFQSYRDIQHVDLEHIDRAVIVGDNGAGKSTLFDVIEFALFGRIRTPKKHGVISTGRDKTFTGVEFTLAGIQYRVTRTLSRKQAEEAQLYVADLDTSTGWTPVTSDKTRSTNEAIVELIGMDADLFEATVLSRQGDSAGLSNAKPMERRRLFGKLLGLDKYETLHTAAKAKVAVLAPRRADAAARLSAIDGQLDEIGPITADDIADAAAALTGAQRQLTAAQADNASIDDANTHADKVATLRRDLDAAHRADTERRALLAAAVHREDAELARSRTAVAEAGAAAAAADTASAKIPKIDAQIADIVARGTKINTEREEIVPQGQQAAANLARAEHSEQAAAVELEQLTVRADSLRRTLHTGVGECFTCGQHLTREQTEQLITRDEDDSAAARQRIVQAQERAEESRRQREQLRARHATLTAEHGAALAEHNNAAAYRATLQTLAAATTERWQTHAAAVERAEHAAAAVAAATAGLAAFTENPATAELATELDRITANAPSATRKAAAHAAVAYAQTAVAEAHRNVALLADGRDRITALTAQRDQLAAELAAIDVDLDIATVLRDAYHPTGVPAMKLRAAIADFNALVQQQLELLSSGAMSIELSADATTAKGTFKDELHLVITGTDGEPRYYDSFSGGQRQRIDWAVRAAAARLRINRTGTPMETFAIDEGWGSLDDAGIVNGAAMLHALSSDFCVLTVSHIPSVQELFPTVLEVRDQGGTSVVTRR